MAPTSATELTVATYNLYLGADLGPLLDVPDPDRPDAALEEVRRQLHSTAFPRRCPAMAELLAREHPDLLGVQELCTWWVDGEPLWDFGGLLLAGLEQRGTPYDVVGSVETFHGEGDLVWEGRRARMRLVGGNAILRRRESDLRVTGTRSGMFRVALLAAPAADLQVSVDRGWCAAEVALPEQDRRVTVLSTHTEAYDLVARDRQLDELVKVLGDGPVIVLGDLNATPAQVRLPDGLVDAWTVAGNAEDPATAATCGQGADLTDPASTLSDRIDYVLVRGLAVESCHRFGAEQGDRDSGLWPSDHAGVSATVHG